MQRNSNGFDSLLDSRSEEAEVPGSEVICLFIQLKIFIQLLPEFRWGFTEYQSTGNSLLVNERGQSEIDRGGQLEELASTRACEESRVSREFAKHERSADPRNILRDSKSLRMGPSWKNFPN